MIMKRITQVIDTEFTLEEREVLIKASELLHELQESFKSCSSLTSLTTGEVVGIEEIARVRGILSAFSESTYFQTKRRAIRNIPD